MQKEKPLSPETEKQVKSKIILHFMRHGKRESEETAPGKIDKDFHLLPLGRAQADAKGKKIKPQVSVSLGWGSPRVRTHETAYRVMLAEENLDPDASLEEIEGKVSREVRFGSKMIVDERLNFNDDGPVGKKGEEAYNKGKYMPWLIKESDIMAIETKDKKSTTYTRSAADFSEIIKRYIKIGNTFNQIVSKTDKYEKYGNQLERYLGTHTGKSEAFAVKVLEKIDENKKEEFINSVGGGFKETQGITIEIVNNGGEQKIFVTYELQDREGNARQERVEINSDLLDEIINDRNEFEKKVG